MALNSYSRQLSNANPAKLSRSQRKIKGKITQTIGSGTDAQYSIICIVLICSFAAIIIISIFVIINYWCFRDTENKVPNITGDLKVIWEIITPIITLALGYAFGKSPNR
jgi:hypothetical protein